MPKIQINIICQFFGKIWYKKFIKVNLCEIFIFQLTIFRIPLIKFDIN